jgi:hypothetical protein
MAPLACGLRTARVHPGFLSCRTTRGSRIGACCATPTRFAEIPGILVDEEEASQGDVGRRDRPRSSRVRPCPSPG